MTTNAGRKVRLVGIEVLRAAGRELNPAQPCPVEGEVLLDFLIDKIIADQGQVPDASLAMVAASRRTIGAVNHRQIELHAESVIDVVTDEHLRNQAVNVFTVIPNRVTARLQRVVIGELFGDATVQSPTASGLRLRRGIDGAQIASHHSTRTQQTEIN